MDIFLKIDEELLSKDNRIIHQIWFGTIPNKSKAKKAYEKLKIYRESWDKHNPSWFRMEWNKKNCFNLVKQFYPEHLEMFNNYDFEIQRCDTIRYMILHRYGGWYADMDYYCNRPLDEAMAVYKNNIYLVETPNNTSFHKKYASNSLMYSVRNHSFWRKLFIELEINKESNYLYNRHLKIMFTTGPGILNTTYHQNKYKFKIGILPYKLFHPYGLNDDKLSLTKNPKVYTIHLGKGSWEDNGSNFFIFLYKEWRLILTTILFFIVLLIFNKYYKYNKY